MISEKERKVFENLKISLALYSTVVEDDLRAELVSDGFCKEAGLDHEELIRLLNAREFIKVHPDDEKLITDAVNEAVKNHSEFSVMFRNKALDNDEYRLIYGMGRWQRMEDDSEMLMITFINMKNVASNIGNLFTSSSLSENDLLYKDPITGMSNFNYFRQFADERIQMMTACNKTPVMIVLNMKSLHSYNMHYGYSKGDDLIRFVAKSLDHYFPGALKCRGSEDNFIIVSEYESEKALEDIIVEINDYLKDNAYGSTSGVRGGASVVNSGDDAAVSLDHAKLALREIGDDLNVMCSFYSSVSDEEYWNQRYIIDTFEEAMEKGWIKIFYQPILRAKSRKITILEALARWIDPVRGMLAPAEFIPVLSRYHLLYKLDMYMVEQICKEFHSREKVGLPTIPVTVNISAQDFDHIDVADEIQRIIKKYGLENRCIIVEVTEQDIAKGTEQFKEQLKILHENGVRIWIDDFGSGYSSLNIFSQLVIDRIKFDMELIKHLDDNNGANRNILKAFVEICREMKIHTLAEGVENEEQLKFLQEIDCELVQGFYFFKPEPIDVSIYKFEKGGAVIPHESREERRQVSIDWLNRNK